MHEIAQANQAHGAAGFGQAGQNPFRLLLEEQRLAVGENKQPGDVLGILSEAVVDSAPEQPQDSPDFLQGQSFAPQFRRGKNLQNLPRRVKPAVILFSRRDELALIPPLELAESDARHLGNIGTEEELFSGAGVPAFRWKHVTPSAFLLLPRLYSR